MTKIELGKRVFVNADIPITAENLQKYVLDKDQTIKTYEYKQGISKANLILYHEDPEIEIDNFIGGIEITKSEAESSVPNSFPGSSKVVYETFTDTKIEWDMELEQEVEVEFENTRVKTITNDDGETETVMEQVNWVEYCGLVGPEGKFLKRSINGKLILEVGRRNVNGRKGVIRNDEFNRFVDYWGMSRIMTKSEMKEIIKVDVGEI